jgi:hypothetical protein
LKSISGDSTSEFGGMKRLLMGDLLHRLIGRLFCWDSIEKFSLCIPIPTAELSWERCLLWVARGQMGNCEIWNDLTLKFGGMITENLE